jgi:hypothetical protein
MIGLRSRLSKRGLPLCAAILATTLSAVVLVAANPLATSGANRRGAHRAASKSSTRAQLTGALAVLSRAATGADAVPAEARTVLSNLDPTANASMARRAMVSPTGAAVYLAPREGGVCLIDTTLTETGCFSTGTVLSGRAIESDACSPGLPNGDTIEIAGVLPNTLPNPTVTFSDGTQQRLHVEGNVFLEQFPRHGPLPRTIAWGAGAARVEVSAHVPSDVASEVCVTTRKELRALEAAGKIPPALGRPPRQPTSGVEYNRG